MWDKRQIYYSSLHVARAYVGDLASAPHPSFEAASIKYKEIFMLPAVKRNNVCH